MILAKHETQTETGSSFISKQFEQRFSLPSGVKPDAIGKIYMCLKKYYQFGLDDFLGKYVATYPHSSLVISCTIKNFVKSEFIGSNTNPVMILNKIILLFPYSIFIIKRWRSQCHCSKISSSSHNNGHKCSSQWV